MSGLILGLYYRPLTGNSRGEKEGLEGGLRGNDRWTHGCWNLDCHRGPASVVQYGRVATSHNHLTANLPDPSSTRTSLCPPLTLTTVETPEQLDLKTLVSREIVCLPCLTPDQPPSLGDSCTHIPEFQACACPCPHSLLTCTQLFPSTSQ